LQTTGKYLILTIILFIPDDNPEREALSMYRDRVEKVMEDYFDAVSLTPVILQLDVVKPKKHQLLFAFFFLICFFVHRNSFCTFRLIRNKEEFDCGES